MADNKRHVVGLVVVDELVTFEALLLHQKGHHLQHLSSSAIVMTLARSTANSRSKVRRTAARHPSGTDLPAWVRRATECTREHSQRAGPASAVCGVDAGSYSLRYSACRRDPSSA